MMIHTFDGLNFVEFHNSETLVSPLYFDNRCRDYRCVLRYIVSL